MLDSTKFEVELQWKVSDGDDKYKCNAGRIKASGNDYSFKLGETTTIELENSYVVVSMSGSDTNSRISVNVYDKPVEGKYNITVQKESASSEHSISEDDETTFELKAVVEDGHSYNFDNDTEYSSDYHAEVVTTGTASSGKLDDDGNLVEYQMSGNSVDTCDLWIAKETEAPSGFYVDSTGYEVALMIHKSNYNNEYVKIDSIDVYGVTKNSNGQEDIDTSNKLGTINEEGNFVSVLDNHVKIAFSQYRDENNNCKFNISVIYSDPYYEYNYNVMKKDLSSTTAANDASDAIAGATIHTTIYKNVENISHDNETTFYTINTDNVTDNTLFTKDNETVSPSEPITVDSISKSNAISKSDILAFYEADSPDGYMNGNGSECYAVYGDEYTACFVGYALEIKKSIVNNELKIDKVLYHDYYEVYRESGVSYEIHGGSGEITSGMSWSGTCGNTTMNVYFDDNTNTITVTFKDKKISGNYNISVGKKKTGTDQYIAGATINVERTDIYDEVVSNDNVISVADKAVNVYNDGINIESKEVDYFTIKETVAPENYKRNENYVELSVVKNISNGEYKASIVDVKIKTPNNGDIEGYSYTLVKDIDGNWSIKNDEIIENSTKKDLASDIIYYWAINEEDDSDLLDEEKQDVEKEISEFFGVSEIGLDDLTDEQINELYNYGIYSSDILKDLGIDVSVSGDEVDVVYYDDYNAFNFNVKKVVAGTEVSEIVAGTEVALPGAKFNVEITSNIEGKGTIYSGEVESKDDGNISIPDLPIPEDGEIYDVKLTETEAPTGYKLNSGTLNCYLYYDSSNNLLRLSQSLDQTYAKVVELKSNEVLIEIENTPLSPHKGVKEIDNQDSGYYGSITDNVTGEVYDNENDANSIQHDWVIQTVIPESAYELKNYTILDKINEELVYTANSVKVTVAGKSVGTDYYDVSYNENTRQLSVAFASKDAGKGLLKDNVGNTLEIRFNTTFALDDNGRIAALNQIVKNQAELDYGNTSTLKTEIVEVHTGGVGLFKYDASTGNALKDATFKIATSEENAKNGIFLKDSNGNDIEQTTDENGQAIFEGLEFGEDAYQRAGATTVIDEVTGASVYRYDPEKLSTDYWLVETEAPEGYILDSTPIKVTAKCSKQTPSTLLCSDTKVPCNTKTMYDLIDLSDVNANIVNSAANKKKGSLLLKLKKVDGEGNALKGVGFKIGESSTTTPESGIIYLTGKGINATCDADATMELSEKKQYSYSITETGIDGYACLSNSFRVYVDTDLANGVYATTQITLNYMSEGSSKFLVANTTTDSDGRITGITTKDGSTSVSVKTTDGKTATISLSIDDNGAIVVTVTNTPVEGNYGLKIYKELEYKDVSGSTQTKPYSGVTFKVALNSGVFNYKNTAMKSTDLTTANTGYTDAITYDITNSNHSTTDVYTITENDVTDGIAKLKNPLKLRVTKKLDGTKYVVNTIRLIESNTNLQTGDISVENGGNITLNGVSLVDGTKVDINVSVDADGLITLTAKNKEIDGGYTVGIKKVNKDTGDVMPGITFSGTQKLHTSSTESTFTTNATGTDGTVSVATVSNITSSGTDTYTIQELSVPDGVLKITDYKFNLTVTPTFDATANEYVVTEDNVKLEHPAMTDASGNNVISDTHSIQEELVNAATVSVDSDYNIIITIYNKKYGENKFALKKVDLDDVTKDLNNTKFTITKEVSKGTSKVTTTLFTDKALTEIIAQNGTTGTGIKEYVNIDDDKLVLPGYTYTYNIYETSAQTDYNNIFGKLVIKVRFTVDTDFNITADYKVINNGGTNGNLNTARATLTNFAAKPSVVSVLTKLSDSENIYGLILPNPMDTTGLNINLSKVEKENVSQGVAGAVFTNRGFYVENETTVMTTNAVESKFSSNSGLNTYKPLTTDGTLSQSLLSLEDVKVGTSYYFEIVESTVPTNYKSTFTKAIVRAHINSDKTVTASIMAIYDSSKSAYVNYSDASDAGKAAITISTSGNSVELKWTNATEFNISIYKKGYDGTQPTKDNIDSCTNVTDAVLTVIDDNTNTTICNNKTVGNGITLLENQACGGKVFKYTIKEDATGTEYYNQFAGAKIKLYVSVNDDGSINEGTSATYVDVVNGTSSYSAAQLSNLKNSIILEVDKENRNVKVYIENKKIHNKFDIKILKVSDQMDSKGNYIGISGITFNCTDKSTSKTSSDTTDGNGYVEFTDNEITGGVQDYTFREDTSTLPKGVTAINNNINLSIDTTGLKSSSTAAEIAEGLKGKVSASIENDSADKVSCWTEGTTVYLMVTNKSHSYNFTLKKLSTNNNAPVITDGDGKGASMTVTDETTDSKLINGILEYGYVNDTKVTQAETEYVYTVNETKAKQGYLNVLQGWDLKVHITTDSEGKIIKVGSDIYDSTNKTYVELTKNGSSQLYSLDEIKSNNWVKFITNVTDNTTTNEYKANIELDVYNPYGYEMRLQKSDKVGTTAVSANLAAQKITGVDAQKLYDVANGAASSGTTLESMLKSVVDASTDAEYSASGWDFGIPETFTITNNSNMSERPVNSSSAQIWEITEKQVNDSKFVNILANKYIIVMVEHNENLGGLLAVSHSTSTGNMKFFVCDSTGKDYTEAYKDYIDINVDQANDCVTVKIKDPIRVHAAMVKKQPTTTGTTDLSGAELKMECQIQDNIDGATYTSSGAKKTGTSESISYPLIGDYTHLSTSITDGSSMSGTVSAENLAVGDKVTFVLSETSTPAGHVNIFGDSKLLYVFTVAGTNELVLTSVQGVSKDGNLLSSSEVAEIRQYISYSTITNNEDKMPEILFTIVNPIEYNVQVVKTDGYGNNLSNATISVNSSVSGAHAIRSGSENTSFTESGVNVGDEITYTVYEVNTVERSAYQNIFGNEITITTKVNESGLLEITKATTPMKYGSGVRNLTINDSSDENFKKNKCAFYIEDNALVIKLLNPTQFDFELTKFAGDRATTLPNTTFDIKDIYGNTMSYTTDEHGMISKSFTNLLPGDYSMKITEKEPASDKYVNILDGKYIMINFNLDANGTITFSQDNGLNYSLYYSDDDNDDSNDVKIIDDSTMKDSELISYELLKSYITIGIDTTNPVQKIFARITNPNKFGLEIEKVNTDGETLPGTIFAFDEINKLEKDSEGKIQKVSIASILKKVVINNQTDSDGKIDFEDGVATPGVYEFSFTETNPSSVNYENILKDLYIKVYVRLDVDGTIRYVKDDLSDFSASTKYRYYIYNKDGILLYSDSNLAYSTDSRISLIKKYLILSEINETTGTAFAKITITNPTKMKLNVIKADKGGNEITGSNFTVIQDRTTTIIDNGEVTSDVEATIDNLSTGKHYYDFYENSAPDGHINILKNKFIRVYTSIDGSGNLTIVDADGNPNSNYFEVYDDTNKEYPTKIDNWTNEYEYYATATDTYKTIGKYIEVSKNSTGVNQLNFKVVNPVNILIQIKKQACYPYLKNIANTTFTVKKSGDNSASLETVFDKEKTNTMGQIQTIEENVMPNRVYTYSFTEDESANETYCNILKDKRVDVQIMVNEDGTISIISTKYCTSDGTEITDENELYLLKKYVRPETYKGTYYGLKLRVYNPPTINIQVDKYDLDNNRLAGADFTITRSCVKIIDSVKDSENKIVAADESKEEFRKDKTYKVTSSNTDSIVENQGLLEPGVYKYTFTETKTPGKQYYNILSNYNVEVYVKVSYNGTITLCNADGVAYSSSVPVSEQFELVRVNTNDGLTDAQRAELEKKIRSYVSIYPSATNGIDNLVFSVQDPITYNVNIIKTTKDKETKKEETLNGSKFTVYRDGFDSSNKVLDNVDITTATELVENAMAKGEHTYYITENSTASGYINILANKFIKVKINTYANGKIEVNGDFEIYSGNIANGANATLMKESQYQDLYNQISIYADDSDNDSVYTLNIKVNNPERDFNFVLNKQIYTSSDSDELNLSGVTFDITINKIYANATRTLYKQYTNVVTDANGNINCTEEKIAEGYYEYIIEETKTAGEEFVNVFNKKQIIVYVSINQDGTAKVINQNFVSASGKYYLFDTENNENINLSDSVLTNYLYVSLNDKTDIEGTSTLNMYIKNPERYNLEIIKKDRDTDERMNGVVYDVSIVDSKDSVTLYDAETFEALSLGTLKTKNVDGLDGVISIPNILMDKKQSYTIVLKEQEIGDNAFDILYKSWANDARIKIDITIQNGKYVASSTVLNNAGSKYVEKVETTAATTLQTTTAEVLNERVKGKYNLTLNKLDAYTGLKLDGAEFDISVEKVVDENSKVFNDNILYKSTDDVKSMEQLIPGKFVVNNGTLTINDIRIEKCETYTIILKETKAPAGYMLLEDPIEVVVTTTTTGTGDDKKFILDQVNIISNESSRLAKLDYDDNNITVDIKNEYFDLALRKSITSVQYADGSDDGHITEEDTENRQPIVDATSLYTKAGVTTADYKHVKNHVRGYVTQEVIYTLRVYNEGEIDGFAEEITDHLPDGLEFVDDDFNKAYGWRVDESDSTGKTIVTNYLSEANSEDNVLEAADYANKELDYKEIQIKCRISSDVKAKTVLTNIAEISESKAKDRKQTTVDIDSVTDNVKLPASDDDMSNYNEDKLTDNRDDYVPGQEDDDDFEKIIVEEFDLALRKYITAVNGDEIMTDSTTKDEMTKEIIKQQEEAIKKESEESENSNNTNENVSTENNESGNNESTENSATGDIVSEETSETTANEVYTRSPVINASSLIDGSSTTAKYVHTKDAVEVSTGDIVIYNIRVYNEGTVDGYASLVKDDIPDGVEFVEYTPGDGSINDKYGWVMVDENDNVVTDQSQAKYIVTDYLSKDNDASENEHLIKAFDGDSMTEPDSQYVQVAFKVTVKQDFSKVITNYAQITDDSDENGNNVKDRDSTTNVWIDHEDDQDIERIRVTYMDLALRKFITKVEDTVTGESTDVTDRIPEVDASKLKSQESTTATYTHTKEPVLVHTTDVVTYTLRVYNEGSKDGYASGIKDDIPQGLEFLPDNSTNKEYEWVMLDKDGNVTTDVSQAVSIETEYLSKENESADRQNLMKAFENENSTLETPEYKDVLVAFKVIEPTTSDRIVINSAQISKQTDGRGTPREDRDSTPNEWLGEDDEDIEKVKVKYFDLALRKWVTQAIVTKDGETTVTETGHHAEDDPEAVVKVDLKKSKVNDVTVKFRYSIRITNQGEIAGEATEISDYIPDGLKFVAEDNPDWKEVDGKIVTDKLAGTTLQPGESAEVEVILTWINDETNMGVKINVAEISKDHNAYGTPDIDSTPNNKVWGEDDIDDAPVMLTIKTGNETIMYISILLGIMAVVGAMVGVKKLKNHLNEDNFKVVK